MILLLSLLLCAVQFWGMPLWAALALLWALLPPITWMEFMAGMSFDRLKHGGAVVIPADPQERQNEPDAQRLVSFILWPPAALDNFILAQLVAALYFRVAPLPWRDLGLTRLLNRMVETRTDWRRDRALAVRRRWLDRYDRRAIHT
jgi:hypothetical protein